jgi:hypothetical protein
MALSVYKNINKTSLMKSVIILFNEIIKSTPQPQQIFNEYTKFFFIVKQSGFMALGEYINEYYYMKNLRMQ